VTARHDGKALGKIATVAREEPHARGVPQRHDAEAVVLNLIEPVQAGRRGFGWRWQAGLEEADVRPLRRNNMVLYFSPLASLRR
jgi:hypothetical protein